MPSRHLVLALILLVFTANTVDTAVAHSTYGVRLAAQAIKGLLLAPMRASHIRVLPLNLASERALNKYLQGLSDEQLSTLALKALKGKRPAHPEAAVSWARKVLANHKRDMQRKLDTEHHALHVLLKGVEWLDGPMFEFGMPDDEARRREFLRCVEDAINIFSPPLRSVFLKSLNAPSYENIANEEGIKIGTTKSRLASARRQLLELCGRP